MDTDEEAELALEYENELLEWENANAPDRGSKKRKKTTASKKKSKKPVKDKRVWFDGRFEQTEYEGFPDSVLYSARFRDGLTADNDVYPSFLRDYNYGSMAENPWLDKFMEHSKVVLDHLYADEEGMIPPPCPCGTHVLNQFNVIGELVSGHKMGWCTSIFPRISFLWFCLENIVGYQSQTFMRSKLFLLLHAEAQHLPLKTSKSASQPKFLDKWMHSLQVVIHVFDIGKDPWLDFKFYGDDDMNYLFKELLPRVNQAFLHLKAKNSFNSEAGSEILCCLLYKMHSIEKQYSIIADYCDSEARKTLFAKLIKKYTPLLEECYGRHHAASVKKIEFKMVKVDEDEDEEA